MLKGLNHITYIVIKVPRFIQIMCKITAQNTNYATWNNNKIEMRIWQHIIWSFIKIRLLPCYLMYSANCFTGLYCIGFLVCVFFFLFFIALFCLLLYIVEVEVDFFGEGKTHNTNAYVINMWRDQAEWVGSRKRHATVHIMFILRTYLNRIWN